MNIPNQLSVLRILLAPAVVASLVYYHPDRDWLRWVALALFVTGAVTDALDGIIARSTRQSSQLGAFLDPIADKLLILGTLIACSTIRGLPDWMRIPAWFNLVVITRDVLVVIGALVVYLAQGRWGLQPDKLGKASTCFQMLVILSVLLHWPAREGLIIAATGVTALSLASYLRLGLRLLS